MKKELLKGDTVTEAMLLSVQKVAAILDCSTRHVYRLEERGQMPPAVRLGNCRRWRREPLEKWIEGGCQPTLAV
jgi:excisionase family DNA binding protein